MNVKIKRRIVVENGDIGIGEDLVFVILIGNGEDLSFLVRYVFETGRFESFFY